MPQAKFSVGDDVKEIIERGLSELNLSVPKDAAEQLAEYGRLLIEQNKVMNLTAITEPGQVASLHFLDSAALLKIADFKGKRVIDVGTGAGFPGLALKLLEPSMKLTLLDSQEKKIDWLSSVGTALGARGVEYLHARAEEQGHFPGYRDAFDLVTARALADMRVLCELCLPFLKTGGFFIAMKSTDCAGELTLAADAIKTLGGNVVSANDYKIPGTGIRHRAVVIEKQIPTPKGYPRRWARIRKSPL